MTAASGRWRQNAGYIYVSPIADLLPAIGLRHGERPEGSCALLASPCKWTFCCTRIVGFVAVALDEAIYAAVHA